MEAMNLVNLFQANFSNFSMQKNALGAAASQGMGALDGMINTVSAGAPKVISAFVVLLIGWIVAKMVKWAIVKVLKTINFDSITDKVGINGYLKKGGMKQGSTGLIASLVYWMMMLTVLNLFFSSLGIEQVSNLFNQIVMYIPKIIVGCIMLVVGMFIGEFVSGIVVGALKGGGVANAEAFGKGANFVVMFFVVSMVLSQLGIGGGIIDALVNIILGSLGLALSLAFGLGGKDWAAGLIDRYLKF